MDILWNSMQRKPRVALVVPNFAWCDWDESTRWRYIPYNLCLLAAAIQDCGEAAILDANAGGWCDAEFRAKLAEFRPDVVGITVLMDQYGPAGHRAARLAKEYEPRIPVVFGGVYATMNPEQVLRDPHVDVAVLGEGEYVFRDLLRYFGGQGTLPEKGIAFRKDGQTINSGRADFIPDLDALPLPAYHLIDYPSYVSTVPKRRHVDAAPLYPYARILTSRGCPFGCSFCQVASIHGSKFRPRSAANVLGEIRFMRDTYGVRSLTFDDDNLFADKKRALAIFRGMLDQGLAMPWVSIATAEFKLDDELLSVMRQSGCEYIDIAVESGSERILKDIIGKPVNLEHAAGVVRKARSLGIYVVANFIVGFPTETWAEIRQSIKLAEDIDADYVKIFAAIPLPHTRLWRLCEETGAFKKGFRQADVRWNAGQIETDQFRARDLGILRAFEWDRINFSDPEKRRRTAQRMGLTEDDLWTIRRKTLDNAGRAAAGEAAEA